MFPAMLRRGGFHGRLGPNTRGNNVTDIYISEGAALRILTIDGDFSEAQARVVLGHSRQQIYEGRTMYPVTYISKRARDHAAKPEPDAWSVRNG